MVVGQHAAVRAGNRCNHRTNVVGRNVRNQPMATRVTWRWGRKCMQVAGVREGGVGGVTVGGRVGNAKPRVSRPGVCPAHNQTRVARQAKCGTSKRVWCGAGEI